MTEPATAPTTAYEIDLEFSREFLRKALRRDHFWWGLYRQLIFLGVAIPAAWLVAGDWRVLLVPQVLITFGAGVILILALCAYRFRRTIALGFERWQQQSPSGKFHYRATAEALHVTLDNASETYPWKNFRRLWRYSDIWLLEVIKNNSVLFPVESAPPEMQDFIVECCRLAGVRM
jgi:hypothetical protein